MLVKHAWDWHSAASRITRGIDGVDQFVLALGHTRGLGGLKSRLHSSTVRFRPTLDGLVIPFDRGSKVQQSVATHWIGDNLAMSGRWDQMPSNQAFFAEKRHFKERYLPGNHTVATSEKARLPSTVVAVGAGFGASAFFFAGARSGWRA